MAVNSTDTLIWRRDDCGDIVIPFQRSSGLEAVASLVRAAINLFVGEWFLNIDTGTRWLPTPDGTVTEQQAILGSKYDSGKIRAELRRSILKVTAVRSVTSIKTTFDGGERTLSVDAFVRSAFGDVQVSTSVTA